MINNASYRVSPSLMDSFHNYVNADTIWEQYWGQSDNPSKTLDEFRKESFESFINHCNKVSTVSEAASKGTAFNDIVDCLVHGTKPPFPVERIKDGDVEKYRCELDGFAFDFDVALCVRFAKMYDGALSQAYVEAPINTSYGIVELHGYIDELMPIKVCDIKTTGSYYFGKFRDHAQHLVYPYCLTCDGCNITRFDYDIVEIPRSGPYKVYQETYMYDHERDSKRIKEWLEDMIYVMENNKHLINNPRLFALDYED